MNLSPGDIVTAFYVAMPTIALASAIVALTAFLNNRAHQRFASATQTYRRLLELSIQWPKLAEPGPNSPVSGSEEETCYEWYVGLVLRACEELIEYAPKKWNPWKRAQAKLWEETIELNLRYHAKYFAENAWFAEEKKRLYSARLLRQIDKVVEDHRKHARASRGSTG